MTPKLTLPFTDCQMQAIVCPLTGISYRIEAPTTLDKRYAFEQRHPLAKAKQALEFAALPYKQQESYQAQFLSGAIISILTAHQLRQDKHSAVQANLLLSQNKKHFLHQVLSFLADLSERALRRLPAIAIVESGTLDSWYFAAKRSYEATIETPAIETKLVARTRSIQINSITADIRKQAKSLLADLQQQQIISGKLALAIKISIPDNNLATMSESLRDKIIIALTATSNDKAIQLALIFKRAKAQASVQENIFSKQMDSYEANPISQASQMPQISAKERLLRKLNRSQSIALEERATTKNQAIENQASNVVEDRDATATQLIQIIKSIDNSSTRAEGPDTLTGIANKAEVIDSTNSISSFQALLQECHQELEAEAEADEDWTIPEDESDEDYDTI